MLQIFDSAGYIRKMISILLKKKIPKLTDPRSLSEMFLWIQLKIKIAMEKCCCVFILSSGDYYYLIDSLSNETTGIFLSSLIDFYQLRV